MKSSSFPLPNQCFTAEIAMCAMQLLMKLQSVNMSSEEGEEVGKRAKEETAESEEARGK